MIKVMKNRFEFRLEMVRLAKKYSKAEAARMCGVSRPTVYKWLGRYELYGLEGLKDRSRKPHCSPHRLDGRIEARIVRMRRRWPSLSPDRMRKEFGITADPKTIYRVLHEHGLIQKRNKKRQRQRDLRKWKQANFNPLRYWQVDTKDCVDIPYYVAQIRKRQFPRYIFSARDVRTGTLFVSYAHEGTSTNAARFIGQLFTHLRSCGLPVAEMVVQTDNGREYFPWTKNLEKRSLFTKVVSSYGARHVRIPPGEKTWQSDVERAHGLIESELLAYERWETYRELTAKTTAWLYYFNRIRTNSYHQNRTNYQRMRRVGIRSKVAETLCHWWVTILDNLGSVAKVAPKQESVNHVSPGVRTES